MVEDWADEHSAHAYFTFSCMLKTTSDLNAVTLSPITTAKFLLCMETAHTWGEGVQGVHYSLRGIQIMQTACKWGKGACYSERGIQFMH